VREALTAEQIYWAEREEGGKRMFRQYVNAGEVNPCVIVDDITRTGRALMETVNLVRELGTRVIGCAVIVRFSSAPTSIKIEGEDDVPILSLVEFEAKWYEDGQNCAECKEDAPVENVRF
jgi:orotate phosphoribosyltransferase